MDGEEAHRVRRDLEEGQRENSDAEGVVHQEVK